MCDDKARVDLALSRVVEQLSVFVRVGLARFDRQSFVHESAEWDLVGEAAVHAGN